MAVGPVAPPVAEDPATSVAGPTAQPNNRRCASRTGKILGGRFPRDTPYERSAGARSTAFVINSTPAQHQGDAPPPV